MSKLEGTRGSPKGCSRKRKVVTTDKDTGKPIIEWKNAWCLFSKWCQIPATDECGRPFFDDDGEPAMMNVMECMVGMNQYPPNKNPKNDGHRAEGTDRWSLEIADQYWTTGNEGFVPGEFEESETMVKEVTKGMDPGLAAYVQELVFKNRCNIWTEKDMLMRDEDRAGNIVLQEYRYGQNGRCPSFLHPSLTYIPGFGEIAKYLDILHAAGKTTEMKSVYKRLKLYKSKGWGNIREVLKSSPEQRKLWLKIQRRMTAVMMNQGIFEE